MGVQAVLISDAQRRLVNHLHSRYPNWVELAKVTERVAVDASVSNLLRAGLILASDAQGRTRKQIATHRERLWLTLSSRGERWVCEDDLNVLLIECETKGKQSFRLSKALAIADQNTVMTAVQEGYLTLHYAEDLKQVTLSRAPGIYEFRHADDFALIGTFKLKRVLALDVD